MEKSRALLAYSFHCRNRKKREITGCLERVLGYPAGTSRH